MNRSLTLNQNLRGPALSPYGGRVTIVMGPVAITSPLLFFRLSHKLPRQAVRDQDE